MCLYRALLDVPQLPAVRRVQGLNAPIMPRPARDGKLSTGDIRAALAALKENQDQGTVGSRTDPTPVLTSLEFQLSRNSRWQLSMHFYDR